MKFKILFLFPQNMFFRLKKKTITPPIRLPIFLNVLGQELNFTLKKNC